MLLSPEFLNASECFSAFFTVEGNLAEFSNGWHALPFTCLFNMIDWAPTMCQVWRVKSEQHSQCSCSYEVHHSLCVERRQIREFSIVMTVVEKKSMIKG